MAARKKLHELGAHNDIRYRGPLSYQTFQVLGWSCIILSIAAVLISMGMKGPAASEAVRQRLGTAKAILDDVTSLSLPFLLIANFSRILSNEEGYKKQLVRNGAAMGGIFLVFTAFFYRYIIRSIGVISQEPAEALPSVMRILRAANQNGFLAFNVFVDLFLCTLVMLFLNYRPTRVFTGKKVILFRMLALLPIAYEVFSMLLKIRAARGEVLLPAWVFPLLTVKPPMTFMVFVLLAVFVKTRELRYCRRGRRTHAEYLEFLKTNRNSLHFSVFLSVLLVIAGIIDLLILAYFLVGDNGAEVAENVSDAMITHSVGYAIGFGQAFPMIFVAPIVLLYSYNRIPKNKLISTLIPIAGITVILLILIQGSYQLLSVSGIHVDLTEMTNGIEEIFSALRAQ